MKIKVKTSEFSKAITNVGKVISSKPIDLILDNILLQANKSISLFTTNLEQAMKYDLDAEILDPSGVTETVLPYDLLKDITPKFKGEYIELDLSKKTVEIVEDSGKFTLHTFSPEAFAQIPEVESDVKFEIPADILKDLIENTVFAASKKEESRKEFRGVYFDIKGNVVNLVATDSTALALNTFEVGNLRDVNFIIPWKAVDILLHIPTTSSDKFEITTSESAVKFNINNISLISLLINGQFPQYENVIPQDTVYYASVNKNILMDALRLIEPFAKRGTNRIVFTFSSNSLTLESPQSEVGYASKVIPCETNGEISLQFYAEKIIEGIEHVKDENVYFGIQGPLHPVLLKGPNNSTYIYVIMPQKPIE